ncbi:uncharacterized protein K02A2.6-like, partial [Plectropomus leopardus]|uniref:uncharacterized protein K02A2.6-like n=1 Tax=Plectropomus leopardus TaxID=160734 RepID=UPI001C4D0CF3
MKDQVKAELDRMQELGVITPISEPTDWVSSMVATNKKDKKEIRICINPKDLNTALKRPHHPMRTVDDVASQMFLRMPFGISSASEVFQRTMEQIFAGYPCAIIVDDILIGGKDIEEHDANLRKVLNRAREVKLRLNPLKCKFRLNQELREHTATDPTLQMLSSTIKHGWPNRLHSLQTAVRPYFPFRDELTIEDDIVMKGQRTVVPQSLQKMYVSMLHRGHPGAEATKRRARGIVFWPTMTKDIEEEVQACSVCNSTKPHQQKEPLHLHPVPELPWSTLAADIFDWYNQQYLVLVDSFSGWFEIDLLRDLTSATVIGKLKRHFSVHGAPHTLITDNGRQFASQRFKYFAEQWDFTHVTSSPEYPQSNGLAERAVRSAKSLMEKSHRDKTDVFLNLLNLRNIPRDTKLGSPAQRLMSRQTRTTLPVSKRLLEPKMCKPEEVHAQLLAKRITQKTYYDKT